MTITHILKYNPFLQAILVLFGAFLLWELRYVLGIVLIAYILMAVLRPATDYLEKHSFRRTLSVIIPYTAFLALGSLAIYLLAPFVKHEATILLDRLPPYIQQLNLMTGSLFGESDAREYLFSQLESWGRNFFQFTITLFSIILGVFAVLVVSVYMALDKEKIQERLVLLLPEHMQANARIKIPSVEKMLGEWIRAQIIIAVFVGLLVLVLLDLFGIESAFALALLAFALEFIPFLGPILASIPALIIALNTSLLFAVGLALGYFLIQQIEAQILSPKVMQKVVGIHPLVIIIGVLVGAELGGILGALLIIPVMVIALALLRPIEKTEAG